MKYSVTHVMELDFTGDTFTDIEIADVGSAAFTLREFSDEGHDYFTQEDLVIRTAAGGGGTLLVENTDYIITGAVESKIDDFLSEKATAGTGSTKTVYRQIQVINATYQTGSLYVSGIFIGDNVLGNNNLRPVTDVINTDTTISDTEGYKVFMCTGGSDGIIVTLPTVGDNANRILKFVRTDSNNSVVKIIPESTETISGLDFLFLTEQYQIIELISDGTNWYVLSGYQIRRTGLMACSDWTNRHIGSAKLTYASASSSFIVGEIITGGTSGDTGIVIGDTGTLLYLIQVTGGGNFNNETITGTWSGCTATVAAGIKNDDNYFSHYIGCDLRQMDVKVLLSSTDDVDGEFTFESISYDNAAGNAETSGVSISRYSDDRLLVQTGDEGVMTMDGSGTKTKWDNEDTFYEIIARRIF